MVEGSWQQQAKSQKVKKSVVCEFKKMR